MVQDLLDYAQIKAGKFRQNYEMFDIRDAINKVMSVLQQKAQDKQIKFGARYENFKQDEYLEETNYMINCDEHRVM